MHNLTVTSDMLAFKITNLVGSYTVNVHTNKLDARRRPTITVKDFKIGGVAVDADTIDAIKASQGSDTNPDTAAMRFILHRHGRMLAELINRSLFDLRELADNNRWSYEPPAILTDLDPNFRDALAVVSV